MGIARIRELNNQPEADLCVSNIKSTENLSLYPNNRITLQEVSVLTFS